MVTQELKLHQESFTHSPIVKQQTIQEQFVPIPKDLTTEKYTFEHAFGNLLQEPIEQTKTMKARQILGESGKEIPDEQLEMFVSQMDYLINCWLDTYERKIFDGKTLREISKSDQP